MISSIYICKVKQSTPDKIDIHGSSVLSIPIAKNDFITPHNFDDFVTTNVENGNGLAIRNFLERDNNYVVEYYVVPLGQWNDEILKQFKV